MKGKLPWVAPLLLIVLGLFLPREWYAGLPADPELPIPGIQGITLLQISFVVTGFMLAYILKHGWKWTLLEQLQLIRFRSDPIRSDSADGETAADEPAQELTPA